MTGRLFIHFRKTKMKEFKRRTMKFILILLILNFVFLGFAFAGQQGHYIPAPMAVRDYVMPSEGFYVMGYNTYYQADKMKNSSGKNLDSVNVSGIWTKDVKSTPITITGTLNVDLDLNVHSAMQTLVFVWATDKKILGADYGFIVTPSWGYTSVNVAVQGTATGNIKVGNHSRNFSAGEEVKFKDQQWGLGDLMIQPLWLGWRGKRYDVAFSYVVTLPTGIYDKNNIANVGMGFFSQHLQVASYFYPFENKTTAFMFTPTYEWNSKKIDMDVQPGQTMTIEYGISQYVHPRVEIGLTGYNQWQITDDSGSAAMDNNKDAISGFGTQLTYWPIKDKCSLTGKLSKEYAGKDRLEGFFGSLNFLWIF
jgi:hypothetical protein